MNEKTVYHNGVFVSPSEANVNVGDIGISRGYGVCDVLPITNGKAFLHNEHWDRLEKSAWELGLHLPVSREDHREIIQTLLEAMDKRVETVIRSVLTGGVSEDHFLPEHQESFIVSAERRMRFPIVIYEEGVAVETVEFRRILPKAKTTGYLFPVHWFQKCAKERSEKKPPFELVYVWDGRMLEASTSNVCIVKDGAIHIPKEDVLDGITALAAMRLATKGNIPVHERNVSLEEFLNADEVFLTASNKGVVPVVSIDGKPVGSGRPGFITKQLMRELREWQYSY
jgi:branched-chain amino acid aminotransferase